MSDFSLQQMMDEVRGMERPALLNAVCGRPPGIREERIPDRRLRSLRLFQLIRAAVRVHGGPGVVASLYDYIMEAGPEELDLLVGTSGSDKHPMLRAGLNSEEFRRLVALGDVFEYLLDEDPRWLAFPTRACGEFRHALTGPIGVRNPEGLDRAVEGALQAYASQQLPIFFATLDGHAALFARVAITVRGFLTDHVFGVPAHAPRVLDELRRSLKDERAAQSYHQFVASLFVLLMRERHGLPTLGRSLMVHDEPMGDAFASFWNGLVLAIRALPGTE